MKSFTITYTITEPASWRSKDGIDIKSNLADDKLVDCQIASSLVAELKEKSVLLDADKLLLGFAEAQKRNIQDTLESLNDFDLNAKNHNDSIHQKLIALEEDSEKKYSELLDKFNSITSKFDTKIISTTEKLTNLFTIIKDFEEKIKTINTYSLDQFSESMNKILELFKKDPELVKLIFKHKFNK